jgi:hypothetical protein
LPETTYYRPGLVFKAHEKSRGHQEICRKNYKQFATDGTVMSETRELIAEFAVHGAEYTYIDPDGRTERAADIRMGWFDLDSQAQQKNWDANEKEIVARHMIRMAEARPGGDFTLWSKPAAQKPWPKYDETHHNAISTLADQLGLVGEALVYESENKNRDSVVAKLNELLSAEQVAVTTEESLTAA